MTLLRHAQLGFMAVGFVLLAVFALQVCQFSARCAARMPGWLQRVHSAGRFGLADTDPLMVGIVRYSALALALACIVAEFLV